MKSRLISHGANRHETSATHRGPVGRFSMLALVAIFSFVALLGVGWGAEKVARSAKVSTKRAAAAKQAAADSETAAAAAANTVEMFAAMKSGDIDVKFIAKDDREARVTFKNKTKRPLSVQLPPAFAAVPVLAQRGGPGAMGAMGMGGMGGQNQAMGGGMGGGMMGGGGMGMGGGMGGGGMFNVPAEKADDPHTIVLAVDKPISFQLALVCLEHGKRDPRPAIPYEIRPLETVTTKPGVAELLTLLGDGKIEQRSAQAAAWHLANGLTWQELAAKRASLLPGDNDPYFTPDQIHSGVKVAEVSMSIAENRSTPEAQPAATTASPGDASAAADADKDRAAGGKRRDR